MTKLAMAVLLVGCGGAYVPAETPTSCAFGEEPAHLEPWREVPAPARAAEAISAGVSSLGIEGAPDVHWYGKQGFDCDPGIAGWIVPGSVPPRCVGGLQWPDGPIEIAYYDGERLSDTGLAHELGHLRALEVTGENDPGHLTHWFAPGGEVEQATDLLASMGL